MSSQNTITKKDSPFLVIARTSSSRLRMPRRSARRSCTRNDTSTLNILAAAENWWAYWRDYWRLRKTGDVCKKDWACKATISVDTNDPQGKWHEEEANFG